MEHEEPTATLSDYAEAPPEQAKKAKGEAKGDKMYTGRTTLATHGELARWTDGQIRDRLGELAETAAELDEAAEAANAAGELFRTERARLEHEHNVARRAVRAVQKRLLAEAPEKRTLEAELARRGK